MKVKKLHNWDVSYKEAIDLQKKLASKVTVCPMQSQPRHIAGIDCAFSKDGSKIIAAVIFFPILCLLSMIVGIAGGYLACIIGDIIPPAQYIRGIQYAFQPYYISYALTKTVFYAFIITSVSSYHGYHVKGGAIEVGKSSTRAVVQSSIMILMANLVLTRIILQ